MFVPPFKTSGKLLKLFTGVEQVNFKLFEARLMRKLAYGLNVIYRKNLRGFKSSSTKGKSNIYIADY